LKVIGVLSKPPAAMVFSDRKRPDVNGRPLWVVFTAFFFSPEDKSVKLIVES
jgi:hypothetical protein